MVKKRGSVSVRNAVVVAVGLVFVAGLCVAHALLNRPAARPDGDAGAESRKSIETSMPSVPPAAAPQARNEPPNVADDDSPDVDVRASRIAYAAALMGVWLSGGRDAWLQKSHGAGFDWKVDPPAIGSTWYDLKDRPQKVAAIRHDPRGYDLVVTDLAVTKAGQPGIPVPIFVRMLTRKPDPEAKALVPKLAMAASDAIVSTVPRDE